MNIFTPEQNDLLAAPLDQRKVVKGRGGAGPKGDYIEGWHAIAEANRIFGFDGWSYTMSGLTQCAEPYENGNKNWVVSYICTVIVTVGGITRQDVGYGSGASKQIGDAHESAVKEAVTDALKRALRSFGNAFGLALYDKTKANVASPEQIASENKRKAAENMTPDDKADVILERLPKAETVNDWQKLDLKVETFKDGVSPEKWKTLSAEMEAAFNRVSASKEMENA